MSLKFVAKERAITVLGNYWLWLQSAEVQTGHLPICDSMYFLGRQVQPQCNIFNLCNMINEQ